MKNLKLLYILLLSSPFLGQKTFSESVKMMKYKDSSLTNDCAVILFKAKTNGPYENFTGSLRIWNELISYEVPLKSYQLIKEVIVKSGRYNIEAKLDLCLLIWNQKKFRKTSIIL